MEKLYLITNPTSGNGRGAKVTKKIKERLDLLELSYKAVETKYPGHAIKLTEECIAEAARSIISIGGDGTTFEVAQKLIHTQIPLGIIPAGTGNDFIKSLNYPKNPIKILDMILEGESRNVDIGLLNEKLFVNACGIGFDVSVLEYSIPAKKYFKGIIPYLWGVILTIINYEPTAITLTIDGTKILSKEILVCSVANGKYIGGGIPISPDSKVDDGLLDIVVLENVKKSKMIRYLPGLLRGKILTFKETTSYTGKHVTITSPNEMKLNVDGEIIPFNKAEFKIVPGDLKVFTPKNKKRD